MEPEMSKNLPWFRLYAEMPHDERIEEIAFEDRWHYVNILCMKCAGLLDKEYANDAMRERKIARELGVNAETAEFIKDRLLEVGLIDENWQPNGWEKRQFSSDSSAERTRKWRQKNKRNVTGTSPQRHSDALDTDTDTDTEADKDDVKRHPSKSASANVPYQKIVDLYHEILPELPSVVTLTNARKSHLRARWKNGCDNLSFWKDYFEDVKTMDFLMGRCKASPKTGKVFQANIDFLIKESTIVNCQEGKYHD